MDLAIIITSPDLCARLIKLHTLCALNETANGAAAAEMCGQKDHYQLSPNPNEGGKKRRENQPLKSLGLNNRDSFAITFLLT